MTKEMFEEITAWQKETFTKATDLSTVLHLKEEVSELEQDLINQPHLAITEYADCFLLLFGSAKLHGLSYEDICKAISSKMEINKQRVWGKVNEKGCVKHIEEKGGNP